ncbi:MAG: CoA transferase [Deltaproteobacteria bacterium]|nr:CoA transferase [Deltaproteobacteria bacterium]
MGNTFKSKTREEWMAELKNLDVCFGKVLHLDESLQDPQVKARKMVIEFDDREKGKTRLLGSPLKLSATPPDIRLAPAHFGEHTEEILQEIGFSKEEIEKLKRDEVV